MKLTTEQISKVYTEIAETYREKFKKDMEIYKERLDIFLGMLPEKAKILDIGCGVGNFFKYFTERGFSVIGVDSSEGMLRVARKTVRKGDFRLGNAIKLEFPDNMFDGVFAGFILHHLDDNDVKKALAEFKRVLKDEGVLLAAVLEGDGEEVVPEALHPGLKMYYHYFQKEEIEKALKDAGFKIIKTRKDPHPQYSQKDIFVYAKK